ncbi:MFS transporter, partial [Burkholderia sp. SIMBA_048]
GIGATLSTAVAGDVADHFGNTTSFFGLVAAGVLAALLVWLAMPGTRVDNGAVTAGEPADASPEQAP